MVCWELIENSSNFIPVDSYCTVTVGLVIAADVVLDYDWVGILDASRAKLVRNTLFLKVGCGSAVHISCLY